MKKFADGLFIGNVLDFVNEIGDIDDTVYFHVTEMSPEADEQMVKNAYLGKRDVIYVCIKKTDDDYTVSIMDDDNEIYNECHGANLTDALRAALHYEADLDSYLFIADDFDMDKWSSKANVHKCQNFTSRPLVGLTCQHNGHEVYFIVDMDWLMDWLQFDSQSELIEWLDCEIINDEAVKILEKAEEENKLAEYRRV